MTFLALHHFAHVTIHVSVAHSVFLDAVVSFISEPTTLNVIGLLKCPIINCPITNCPVTTWPVHCGKWKFSKPITIKEVVILMIITFIVQVEGCWLHVYTYYFLPSHKGLFR